MDETDKKKILKILKKHLEKWKMDKREKGKK
jgi:hypothetical protein